MQPQYSTSKLARYYSSTHSSSFTHSRLGSTSKTHIHSQPASQLTKAINHTHKCNRQQVAFNSNLWNAFFSAEIRYIQTSLTVISLDFGCLLNGFVACDGLMQISLIRNRQFKVFWTRFGWLKVIRTIQFLEIHWFMVEFSMITKTFPMNWFEVLSQFLWSYIAAIIYFIWIL